MSLRSTIFYVCIFVEIKGFCPTSIIDRNKVKKHKHTSVTVIFESLFDCSYKILRSILRLNVDKYLTILMLKCQAKLFCTEKVMTQKALNLCCIFKYNILFSNIKYPIFKVSFRNKTILQMHVLHQANAPIHCVVEFY